MTSLRDLRADRAVTSTQDDIGLADLFARNRFWASSKTRYDPGFFSRLVDQQRPKYFWIGCSDSRVPATEIVDLDPGEMFVHRNVANLASFGDPNFSAALQFAVEALDVEHIIVVGHYGCGGIQAAMQDETPDDIGRWLAPVRMLHRHQMDERRGIGEADALCECNVIAQVEAIAANPLVRRAWETRTGPTLHGWVYAIHNGLLQTVCEPVPNPRSHPAEGVRPS
jgi:carbonic anhydrase